MDISVAYDQQPGEPTVTRLRQKGPAELFTDFFRQKNGAPPPAALLQLFESVYEEATHS